LDSIQVTNTPGEWTRASEELVGFGGIISQMDILAPTISYLSLPGGLWLIIKPAPALLTGVRSGIRHDMKLIHIFLMICTATVWGYNFIAIRVVLEVFSPEQLAFTRAMITLIVLLPWWKPWERVSIRFLGACLAIGAIAFYLLFFAVQMTDSLTTVAIGTQLLAPISALVAFMFYREVISKWKWFGILLASGGAIYIATTGASVLSVATLGITVLSVLFYSVGSVVAIKSSSVNIWRMLAWISAVALVPTALMATLSGPLLPDPALLDMKHWMALVFAILISALLGHAVILTLYRIYPISNVVPYVLLTPVFAALFAILVYDETIELKLLTGGILVLAGVWIQQLGSRRPRDRQGMISGFLD
jgi:O-acetylserine/cysteine efflux transporter